MMGSWPLNEPSDKCSMARKRLFFYTFNCTFFYCFISEIYFIYLNFFLFLRPNYGVFLLQESPFV